MEVGDKLKELKMTVEEVDRLNKAFKDEKFMEMLKDYADELSDPENKKKYEEEIKLLEQERGNTIEFIHPEPFRALRTSVDGKHKCFINICASGKVAKPECKWGVSEEGRRGQCWSLPHSLHPGRQDTDPKGKRVTIYDVVFHPDTLHMASKNKRFMDMVVSTALEGIQSNFKVTLDKNNTRELKVKYKGTPQPCVLRKPIPGYKSKEASEKPDPLAFPYPDTLKPTGPQSKNSDPGSKNNIPVPKHRDPAHQNCDSAPKTSDNASENEDPAHISYKIQPHHTKEPTKPHYTVKYRSFIDLQDFRCSRDSAQSPRPKEIVVTVNLPLLKGVADANLEVKDRKLLLLESKEPAYRLELPLAYPVDEDKGGAKFNKQRGQLTVTLPVLPSDGAFDFIQTGVCDGQTQEVDSDEKCEEEQGEEEVKECQEAGTEEDRVEEEKEDLKKQKEEGGENGENKEEEHQENQGQEHVEEKELKENEEEEGVKGGQKSVPEEKVDNGVEEERVERGEEEVREGQESDQGEESVEKCEEGGRGQEEVEEQVREGEKGVVEEGREVDEKEKWRKQNKEGGNSEDEEKETCMEKQEGKGQECLEEEEVREQKQENDKGQGEKKDQRSEEENETGVEEEKEVVSVEESITDEMETWKRKEETSVEEKEKPKQQQREENTEELKESKQENEMEGGRLRAEDDLGVTVGSYTAPLKTGDIVLTPASCKVEDKEKNMASVVESSPEMKTSHTNEKVDPVAAAGSSTPAGTSRKTEAHSSVLSSQPLPLLREIDEDGNEKVISDYTTSAEFIFINKMMFELD